MLHKYLFFLPLLFSLVFTAAQPGWTKVVIHSKDSITTALTGYDGLTEKTLFKGKLTAGVKQEIETPYQGLALLTVNGAQSYPLLLGETPLTLTIGDPAAPPVFTTSPRNDALYKALTGSVPVPEQYAFARLMIQAQKFLESSHSIRSVDELTVKREEFQEFVRKNYQQIRYSDLVRRFVGQYFMMHEYVSYHAPANPENGAGKSYKETVLSGVEVWLELLKPYIPRQEILNYCVSLYYNRSMVTLAFQIMENFPDHAWCAGLEQEGVTLSPDLKVVSADGKQQRTLSQFMTNKLFAFVSDECPVSMVATIIKARQAGEQKDGTILFVAPLQKLSATHLAMNMMVTNGNMFFIDDEKWRKQYLAEKIKLPFFLRPKAGID